MTDGNRIRVIAEAGVNHNGSLEQAKRLAQVAARSGADFVKYQTFDPAALVTAAATTADYQSRGGYDNQRDMLERLSLSQDDTRELAQYCDSIGISFLSTPFDLGSFTFLEALGQRVWKIASGEITNVPLIEAVARVADEVILSTGMATLGEIEAAIGWLDAAGCPRWCVTVLHCNTQYPTPITDVHLRAMGTIRAAFGVRVGYSDHTLGIEVPCAAAALGASVIEKHFTLDRALEGPDHAASLEPDELREMVRSVRSVQDALGDERKLVTASERQNRPIVRKSIVASRPIRNGERLSEANITCKRPGTGISSSHWHDVIGRVAHRDYDQDDFIEW